MYSESSYICRIVPMPLVITSVTFDLDSREQHLVSENIANMCNVCRLLEFREISKPNMHILLPSLSTGRKRNIMKLF